MTHGATFTDNRCYQQGLSPSPHLTHYRYSLCANIGSLERGLKKRKMAAAQQAMHALRRSPFLRFGVGAGTAVVTERALSTATGNPQALTHWLAGTTAGGSVFGFIGKGNAKGNKKGHVRKDLVVSGTIMT